MHNRRVPETRDHQPWHRRHVDTEVVRALPTDRDVVGRLLELNAYEFSRIDGRTLGRDGLFGYPYLDAYWAEPGRVAYLLRADDELAGLALVRRVEAVSHLAEFLVLPKFRRAGVGTEAARQVFAAHPGPWCVRQVAGNGPATQFWRRAIPVAFTEEVSPGGEVTQTFTV